MRRALFAVAVGLAVLGALAIRVVLEGRAALAEGDAALKADRPFDAIRAYETAARWYLPLAPHVDDAYAKLRALTASDQPGVAFTAWRSIRHAAHVTRTLWQPHRDDLAAADAAIAEQSARTPSAGPAGDTTAAREAWYRARLARDTRASIGAAALAGFGILVWLAAAFALARWGVADRRRALYAGVAIVVGLACWGIGLYNA